MKKKTPAIPRYIVVDTKTGETVRYINADRRPPVYRGKDPFVSRTVRRLLMIGSCFALVFGVACGVDWLFGCIPFLGGFLGDVLAGGVNVLVFIVTVTEWFEIDGRLEAYDVVAAQREYYEDAYFDLLKKIDAENRQA